MTQNTLAALSFRFLAERKVHRYRMKKIAEMTDDEVVHTCHWYVEENRLTREWEDFRRTNE